MATSSATDLWDVLVGEACAESRLWADALLPDDEQAREPVFSALCEPAFALAVETVYEGYLLHYGRSRLFGGCDRDTALLLGDYLYAHGLVRIASSGSVEAVRDLAELISLCAQARASGDGHADGAAWAATCALLGTGSLDDARRALRAGGDAAVLDRLARSAAGDGRTEAALAAHGRWSATADAVR